MAQVPSGHTDPCIAQDWQRSPLRTTFTEAATPIPSGAVYLGFTSLAVDDAVRTARGRRHISAAAAARIWLGFHFRDAVDDGYRLGHRTGKLVRVQYRHG